MSFAQRFWDDDGFGITADPDQLIPVVGMLLDQLGLEGAARSAQIAGIRAWFREHTASPHLIRSIELEGYSEALDEFRASA